MKLCHMMDQYMFAVEIHHAGVIASTDWLCISRSVNLGQLGVDSFLFGAFEALRGLLRRWAKPWSCPAFGVFDLKSAMAVIKL